MYLFVHFPTDILGGMVLGTLIAFLVHWAVESRRTG
ncbi:phosphatase PAP2 family protein [Lacrimispora sp.]